MTYAMVVGAADGSRTPHDGRYVKAWNPHVEYGTLELTSTADRAEAHQFKDAADVLRQWQTVSRVQSLRPDLQPNKPLTAVTLLIENSQQKEKQNA